MNIKLSGSTAEVHEAAVAKIQSHAKYTALVSELKRVIQAGGGRPLDALVNPQLADLADEIAIDIPITTQLPESTAQMTAQALYRAAAISDGNLTVKNNAMISYFAEDAHRPDTDSFLIEGNEASLKIDAKLGRVDVLN